MPAKADTITKCKNTTDDTTEQTVLKMPIKIHKFKRLRESFCWTTVYRGQVYFPIYEPTKSVNKCSLGDAYICGVDDECGTNISSELGQSLGNKNKCAWVGQGVLSKIVTFGDTLFANIAGKVDCSKITDQKKKKECEDSKKKDLISIKAGSGQVSTYRNSWRHNF